MARGPIAYNPIEERLVTVQGFETWALGRDDVWEQLGGAPIAGLPLFDGLNIQTAGASIAFDAVDGHVILYGNEGDPAGGAIYALENDVWTRRADAPPSLMSTPVENLDTGRVDFVCRSTGPTNGTLLTWDGSAMVAGPVDDDPRSGCAGTYDAAQHRLLAHGGTGDGVPNVQALPSTTMRVLAAGASAWTSISDALPAPMRHNEGGVWHYNSVLDRILLRGADTGSNTSRTTTTWNGSEATPALTTQISFGPPFFDGAESRFVEGFSEQVFQNNGWVNRALGAELPSEAFYTYDEDADAAFGWGGYLGGFESNVAFTLRGSTRTVLPATVQPTRRSFFAAPSLAYDPVEQRVVLVGGYAADFSGALHDTWAYQDDDWRPLDDLPADTNPLDAQVAFDGARGVIVGFFSGRLFDLRGTSWVERRVDIAPRADALMVYDRFNEDLLFVGGLDFEVVLTTMTRVDIGGARPALVGRFDLRAAGASRDAAVQDVRIDAIAGATGADASGVLDEVELMAWQTTSFVPLASEAASAAAPDVLTLTTSPATLGAALRDELVLALVAPPTGPGEADARVAGEQLEVTLRYREP